MIKMIMHISNDFFSVSRGSLCDFEETNFAIVQDVWGVHGTHEFTFMRQFWLLLPPAMQRGWLLLRRSSGGVD
jgi:hypothetical protein